MLTQLHIKNVAVIDETEITLGAGLNVLTGETGAGKSIVIDSVNMILGERGGRDLVRHGQESALIQASFDPVCKRAAQLVDSFGASEEDGSVVLTRRISENGKSTCRLNSAVATSSLFRELGTLLVDIHGQHDNQRLLSAAHHIEFLDSFGKDTILPLKERYSALYERYMSLSKRLDALTNNESSRLERIDFLTFRCDELCKAQLCEGEEEELLAEEKLLSNAEDVIKSLSASYSALYDGEFTAYDALSAASKSLCDAADFDDELKQEADELSDILYRVGDIASHVRARRDSLDFDPARLDEVQERLALISSLKRKYGGSVEDVLASYEQMQNELMALTDSGESAEGLRAQLAECEAELSRAADELSSARTAQKERFEGLVLSELCDLDMERTQFFVQMVHTENYAPNGCDRVEFLISTNPGEPPKPLSKIASGGELSRIMLALKTVLADSDEVETLIFDEIDTGVSGRAAGKIAAKLCKIAKRRQIICITHLAQIACAADNHYLIKKDMTDDASSTHIMLLDESRRIDELSRILGALTVTETTRTHAREMRRDAIKMKAEME